MGGLQVQMRGKVIGQHSPFLPWPALAFTSPAPFRHPILCDEAFANDTGGVAMVLISWAMWGSIPYS